MKKPSDLFMKFIKYLFFLSTLLVFSSCFTSGKFYKEEPILYQKKFETHHKIVHTSKDTCSLFVVTDSDEYELSITAYSNEDQKIILAEKTKVIENKADQTGKIAFKVRDLTYLLEISIRDMQSNSVFRDLVHIDKTEDAQGISIKDDAGNEVVKPYVNVLSKLTLTHPTDQTLWVKYFEQEFKPSAPPFSDKGYKFNPKKNFSAAIPIPNGGTIKLEGEGLYFIQTDTSFFQGIYINVFNDKYPRISSATEMVKSTRYITKLDEYKLIMNSNDLKDGIDEFWLGRASDKEFAKDLIKAYYTKVQLANRDFTTYKEGWKTDRGMLFIIFGKPKEIQKTKTGEIWGYPATDKRNSVRFEFKKRHGQSLLVRMEYFKRPWDVEVYEWRKGILNN